MRFIVILWLIFSGGLVFAQPQPPVLEAKALYQQQEQNFVLVSLSQKSVLLQSVDRPKICFFPQSYLSDATLFIARFSGSLPQKFQVEKTTTQTVNWHQASEDPELPKKWQQALVTHYQKLVAERSLVNFARYCLYQLQEKTYERQSLFTLPFRRRPSTFDLTTGSAAIQESLQLDRMREASNQPDIDPSHPLSAIEPVTISSHPWQEMLREKENVAKAHPLMRFVPHDQYSIEAKNLAKLLELEEYWQSWGGSLLSVYHQTGEALNPKQKVLEQLTLGGGLADPKLAEELIGRMAITGSDPFWKEGSDVTLVVECLSSPALFAANMKKNYFLLRFSGWVHSYHESYHLHEIRGVFSDDRSISSFYTIVDSTFLISNSLPALQRALDAFDGRIPSQADALDRKYIRTLLPRSEKEDVFIFLSDPFIRYLVSPEFKISESRRLEVAASLRIISYAQAWHQIIHGQHASSIEELFASGCLQENLLRPFTRQEFRLTDDPLVAKHKEYGTLHFLTPNREISFESVTEEERDRYRRFRNQYQRYWSNFFDPVGIQIQLGDTNSFHTHILPLIELSAYINASELFGPPGTQMGPAHEWTEQTNLLVSFHINKSNRFLNEGRLWLIENFGWPTTDWIGDRVAFFAMDHPLSEDWVLDRSLENLLWALLTQKKVGMAIEVKDTALLHCFLDRVHLEEKKYGNLPYQIHIHRRQPQQLFFELDFPRSKASLYVGQDHNMLYLATNRDVIATVLDASEKEKKSENWLDKSHLALQLRPFLLEQTRNYVAKLWLENTKRLLEKNLLVVQELKRCNLTTPKEISQFAGYSPGNGFGKELPWQEGEFVWPSKEDIRANIAKMMEKTQRIDAKSLFSAEGLEAWLQIGPERKDNK